MKKILSSLMSIIFSLSMYGATAEMMDADAIREELALLDKIVLRNDFTKTFVPLAKISDWAKLFAVLSDDDAEKQALLSNINEAITSRPNQFALLTRAVLHAFQRNDTVAAVADITAAITAPKSGNANFDAETKKLMQNLIDNADVKKALLIKFNESPRGKEKGDLEAFLKTCGIDVKRSPHDEANQRTCSRLALDDLLSALRLMPADSKDIADTYCLDQIQEVAGDYGVQQEVERRRQKQEIDVETEILFKHYEIFQQKK